MPTTIDNPIRCAALILLLGALAGSAPAQSAGILSPADPAGAVETITSPPAQQQQLQRGRGGGGGGRGRGGGGGASGAYKLRIEPHWFASNTKFWYTNGLPGANWEFILVDAELGKRAPAFDHEKLAAGLSKAADQRFQPRRLPFSEIEFIEDGKAIKFDAGTMTWKCDLNSYECSAVATNSGNQGALFTPPPPGEEETQLAYAGFSEETEASSYAEAESLSPQQAAQTQGRGQGRGRGAGRGGGGGGGGRGQFETNREVTSPDDKWIAFVRDFNVFVRPKEGGAETQLSQDGVTNNAYRGLSWARDSQALAAWRVEPGDRGMVYLIQSSPRGGGRAIESERPYGQAGDKYAMGEINVFDIAAKKQIKPQTDRWTDGNYGNANPPAVRWERDGRHFTYELTDRGHQRWRLVEVDALTGSVRNLIDETSPDFIWTAHSDPIWTTSLIRWVGENDEFLYISERDGWRHLYFCSVKDGGIKNQMTKGEWVVRALDLIDESKRQVWFQASGKNPGENPYNLHFFRINFDGTELTELTGGEGTHSIQYSPDYKYLIDTYSKIDAPPKHTLHRVSDGKLICDLEDADISELKSTGWRPAESFVAKGRDGKTDIYGTITWPPNMDPTKKYPVLESIYAGPQQASVQHAFSSGGGRGGGPSWGSLGFIVVQIDGMGTPNRSHAFHATCWKNLGRDAGFPDRILWHKAVAAKYPAYDISRVGIFGTSAGGQSAASAVIFHPEFYRAAVANSGCVDNRIDKASWNEQWMGYIPGDKIWKKDPDNWYSECSCIDNASKLGGALLLLVGEQDSNVPPESTLRLADALMTANKDFEMYYVPNAGHGITVNGTYTQRKQREFFQRALLGQVFPLDNSRGGQN